MISKISKITIFVSNQDNAKKFWTEKMDFDVKFEQPMGPNMIWLEVGPKGDNGTTFVLYNKETMLAQNPEANVDHPNVILSTTDIKNAYENMKSKGVNVGELQVMPYGSMFLFKDNDNNNYLLREDK